MGAFLCWLGVRLLEMRRVLTDEGSLYLHIDHTAHAWAKCLLDAVFGKANFRNAIVWRSTTAHSDANRFEMNTEIILFYTRATGGHGTHSMSRTMTTTRPVSGSKIPTVGCGRMTT